jgi:hypothetical protein
MDCLNDEDLVTGEVFQKLSPEEQVNIYRVRSSVLGKSYCFKQATGDSIYAKARDENTPIMNPYTNTPIAMEDISEETLETLESRYQAQAQAAAKKANPKSSETLVKDLGVATCKEIRAELEASKMTDEEKLVFLEQNNKSNKKLKAYIQSQHLSLPDLKFFKEAGSAVMSTLGKHAREVSEMLFDQSFDESDVDCAYLKQLLNDLKQKKSPKPKVNNGVFDRIKEGVSEAAKKSWDGVKVAGKSIFNAGVFVAKWFSAKAFEFGKWLASNPQTAFFVLFYLRGVKNQLCRFAGRQLGYYGPETKKEWMLAKIKEHYPDYVPKPNTSWQDLKNMLSALSTKAVQDVLVKSGGDILSSLWNRSGELLTKTLGGAVTSIPVVGGALGGLIEVTLSAVVDATGEEIKLMQEAAIYSTQLNHAFGMLTEVVDPTKCMDEMMKSMASTLAKAESESTHNTQYLTSGRGRGNANAKTAFLSKFNRSSLQSLATQRAYNLQKLDTVLKESQVKGLKDVPRAIQYALRTPVITRKARRRS